MFKNRIFVLSILALLAFSIVGPASAAPSTAPHKAALWEISGNAGVAGAVLSYDDPDAKTVVADDDGSYSFFVSDAWSGTVTPSLSGYIFTPSDITYAAVVTDQTAQDYVASALTSTPTDVVAETETSTPTLTSTVVETGTETSTATETLTVTATLTATATLTPTPTVSQTITPKSTSVGLNGEIATLTPTNHNSNFTKLSPANGALNIALPTVKLSWNVYSAETDKYRYCIDTINNDVCDSSGGYTSVLATSITLTNFTGHTTYYWDVQAIECLNSNCSSKTVHDSNNGAWWSFRTAAPYTSTPTRTPALLTISGNAGVAGATLSYNNGGAKTVTSNGGGYYSLTVPFYWTGVVTVSRSGYTYTSNQIGYTSISTNQTNKNYVPNQAVHVISGNVSVAGATVSFNDGGIRNVISDSGGRYSILVPNNWSGTVTPLRTGITFIPLSHSYSNVIADLNGQNFTTKLTYKSLGSEDGWVLESTETSIWGGSMDSIGNTFVLGDDALDRQYRSILSFSTSTLPDNAIIQSAVLRIKQSGPPVGASPFTVLGSIWADVRQVSFGSSSLELSDFSSSASALAVGYFGSVPVGDWYSLTLSSTGRSYINRTGATQFRLRFGKDDNDNTTANYMRFISGNYSNNQPELVITYTLP